MLVGFACRPVGFGGRSDRVSIVLRVAVGFGFGAGGGCCSWRCCLCCVCDRSWSYLVNLVVSVLYIR